MVPFHESDLAENRWKEGEWRQFELWERIELRFRRKRFWMVVATAILFLALLAIPIVQDRAPKWIAKKAIRRLAIRANQMKVDAAALGTPMRLRIVQSERGLDYVIEKVESCPRSPTESEDIRSASAEEWTRAPVFATGSQADAYTPLLPEDAKRLGLERVVSSFCYQPSQEAGAEEKEATRVYAMGILTAKDLADGRLDRAAFLNFSGPSAEIDFD